MRIVSTALAMAVVLLYFTVGLRLGYVTLTETYLLNADGVNVYVYHTLDDNQRVGVTGRCQVRNGRAVLRLFGPSGKQVAGQVCEKGVWSLSALGGGQAGTYRLNVEFSNFTGSLDIKVTRQTAP